MSNGRMISQSDGWQLPAPHIGAAGPAVAGVRRLPVYFYDVFVGLSLAAVMLQIGKLGVLPVTLQVLLGIVVMACRPFATLNSAIRCLGQPFMLAFFVMFLVTNLSVDARFGVRFGIVASIGRCFSTLALMVTFVDYCASHPSRPSRLLYQIMVLLTVAQAWYLAELLQPGIFVPIRTKLYYDWYLLEAYEKNVSVESLGLSKRTGLSPLLHLLGYLSCAALGYSLVAILSLPLNARFRQHALTFIMLGVSAVTIALNLQRASLAGGVLGASLMLFSPFRSRLAARLPLVAAAVAVIAATFVPALVSRAVRNQPNVSATGEYEHIGDKLSRSADVAFRLRMQFEALRLIAMAPLGLEASGISWEDQGRAAAETATNTSGGDITVHNGYLSLMLQYGWFAVAAILVFLVSSGRAISKCIRRPCDVPGLRAEAMVAIAAACFGLVFVQPSLHHGNIFKREPTSLVFTSLLAYCVVSRGRLERQSAGVVFRQRDEHPSFTPVTGAA
jgi:hypothetical protein